MKEFAIYTIPTLSNIAALSVFLGFILLALIPMANGRKAPPYELLQSVSLPLRIPSSERSSKVIQIPPHSEMIEKFPAKFGLHQFRIKPVIIVKYFKSGEESQGAPLPPPRFDARLLFDKGLYTQYELEKMPKRAVQNTTEWQLLFRSIVARKYSLVFTNSHDDPLSLQLIMIYSPPEQGDKLARTLVLILLGIAVVGLSAFVLELILRFFS
jgi:hypothetical protein